MWTGNRQERKRLVLGGAFGVSGRMSREPAAPSARPGPNQLLIDLGPIAVFVVAYNVLQRLEATKDNAVYIATAIFIAATLAAIGWCKFKIGRIPPVLIVTGVVVTAFGGLTLLLRDENYIKIKPTIVYLFYAAVITGSVLLRQNIWRLLFRHIFTLPDRIWTILALRWAAFFGFMAAVNEVIRQTQTTEFWVNSRILIVFPLIVAFALLNTPLVLKHTREDKPASEDESASGA
jgi:intracellular septation protein